MYLFLFDWAWLVWLGFGWFRDTILSASYLSDLCHLGMLATVYYVWSCTWSSRSGKEVESGILCRISRVQVHVAFCLKAALSGSRCSTTGYCCISSSYQADLDSICYLFSPWLWSWLENVFKSVFGISCYKSVSCRVMRVWAGVAKR